MFKKVKVWYKNKELCDRMAQIAHDFQSKYPNSFIACIGQSPAWLMFMLQQLEKKQKTREIAFVPFSRRFYSLKSFIINRNNYKRLYSLVGKRPKYEKKYRTILTDLGLSPEKIIDRYHQYGRKTIIVDYVDSGTGLASFLSVLLLWAREIGLMPPPNFISLKNNFEKAISVCILRSSAYKKCSDILFCLPEEKISICSSTFTIDTYIMTSLMADTPNRLVAFYPYECWDKLPNNPVNKNILEIEKALRLAIKTYQTKAVSKQKKSTFINPNGFYKPMNVKSYKKDSFVMHKKGNRYLYTENKFSKYVVQNNCFGYSANISQNEIKDFKNEIHRKFHVTI